MRLRLSLASVGTALSVVAAVAVTAQAMSAPPKPYKARDIVSTNPALFADACVMYPAECRIDANGMARIAGRRIVPGAHGDMLRHFGVQIGTVDEQAWDAPQHASRNTND